MDMSLFPRGVPDRTHDASFPDAGWWSPEALVQHERWKMREGAIFVGQTRDAMLGVCDDRHIMTIAGSRAGKGRSVIIPNMCLYPGSVVVIDPKGDLATVTAARRGKGSDTSEGMGQAVYVLDPFMAARGNAEQYRAAFNPIDAIDPDGEDGRDDAALLADALIIPSHVEAHWTDAAKLWITGLILHVASLEDENARTLLEVRARLTGNEEALTRTLAEMSCSDRCGGAIARAANTLIAMSDRERSSVLSTAIVQTDFLDSPAMAKVLSHSDFTLADIKNTPCTIYLSLPAGRMGTHSRWLRLMIALTIEAMERNRARPEHPALIIMDEFHVLGPMSVIERAAGLIAGFGVRLWPVLQDLTQLKRDYPESWETFLGNAGLTQWFGLNDLTTLEYLSKRLGQTTLESVSQGEISMAQAANGYSGKSTTRQVVDLMSAEEIGRYFSRQSGRQLVLWPGTDPIALSRTDYDRDAHFMGKFDPDPAYEQPAPERQEAAA
ncbi:type IV secretory system conjugative DNA transfer family protein [Hyphococcus sp.]|uniref:type IV secretory system conjugative DNA transfer family protein n=1 Tax=Hyphococcus sp. TaxID=2038636 RepID=UPI003D123390